eukprot:685410_1
MNAFAHTESNLNAFAHTICFQSIGTKSMWFAFNIYTSHPTTINNIKCNWNTSTFNGSSTCNGSSRNTSTQDRYFVYYVVGNVDDEQHDKDMWEVEVVLREEEKHMFGFGKREKIK